MKRENQIREALALAAADPTWRVHTKTADVEVAVIGLATYNGRAMMAEIDRLRAVVGCEECGGRGWALDDASDPTDCEACKTDRQALGLSAPN